MEEPLDIYFLNAEIMLAKGEFDRRQAKIMEQKSKQS